MVNPFDDVIGHGPVLALLTAELAAPAQAYLFVGPANTGKALVARRFAAALLCAGSADTDDCFRRATGGFHPDLVIVEPDGKTAITVDQARATIVQASLSPVEGDRKVFLFEEAGLMNDEAANALLKTLEEPSATTIFVLVAESVDELPATVASRSRTIVFGRVSEDEVAGALRARGVNPDRAAQAARISGGRPGLATAFASRPEVAGYRRVWLSVPLRLDEHPGTAYRLADEVTAAAEPLLEALRERHEAELAGLGQEGTAARTVRERHERELKRATTALHVTGLEILASFYRDAAAAQFGAPVRNADVPPTEFTRILPDRALTAAGHVFATIEALQSAQRPRLAFAALFSRLAGDD